jgi:hypothetical protein
MRLGPNDAWLGYCLNVHPTETLGDVCGALLGPVREVKRRVSPDATFGVGLRLSAAAAADPKRAAREIGAICAAQDYAAFTMNGFPYGRFQGAPVKTSVYDPDWTTPERRRYTRDLALVMASLAPEGETATISTVPGGFGPNLCGREAEVARGLLDCVADLVRLERDTGRRIALALEPEPWCLLDSVADAIAFFRDRLFCEEAAHRLARMTALHPADASEALPRHLGICLDVCHLAVGFEDPEQALAALAAAKIPIHKIQLSAALRVDRVTSEARARLGRFDDGLFLHQVVVRSPSGRMKRFLDLPDALAQSSASSDDEWRVHFHTPIFAEPVPPLKSTRDVLETMLATHRRRPRCRHLEVETYTWGVLPLDESERLGANLSEGISKELEWVLQRLS